MSTGDSGHRPLSAGNDLDEWRLRTGYLGHDNIPHFWNPQKECWLPFSESSPDEGGKNGATKRVIQAVVSWIYRVKLPLAATRRIVTEAA